MSYNLFLLEKGTRAPVINGEIGYSEYSGAGNEVRLRLKLA